MRKPGRRIQRFVIIASLVGSILLFSGSAHATWYWTHGVSGHIERKDVTDLYAGDSFEYGWGLDILQKPGTFNWVHFAVPAIGNANKGARYIKLRFYTGSVDAWVSDVHVYNGNVKVKELKGTWSNGWKTVRFDLGSVMSFTRGLGISVRINAGVESMSHRFIFSGAGANFVKK